MLLLFFYHCNMPLPLEHLRDEQKLFLNLFWIIYHYPYLLLGLSVSDAAGRRGAPRRSWWFLLETFM